MNSSTFSPGDSILFNRGDTWRGTKLTLPSAGSLGSPITVGSYGSGGNPVISGGTIVGGWTQQPEPGSNLFTDPSFETWPITSNGWTVTGTVTQDTSVHSDGGSSARLNGAASVQQSPAVTGGASYTFSYDHRDGDAGATSSYTVKAVGGAHNGHYLQGDGSFSASVNSFTVSANTVGFATATKAFTAPSDATNITINVLGLAAHNNWVDNFQLSIPSSTYAATLASQAIFVLAGNTPLTLGSGSSSLSSNQFYWASNTLYVNLGGTDPGTVTVEAGTAGMLTVVDGSKNYITWNGIEFRFGETQLSLNSAGQGSIITRCTFRYAQNQTNQGAIFIQNTRNVSVTGCLFDNLMNDGIYVHNTPLVTISGNTFTALDPVAVQAGTTGSQAIHFDETYGTTPNSDGFLVSNNNITCATNSTKGCITIIAGGVAGASAQGTVTGNTCTGGNWGVSIAATGVTCTKNVCLNQVSTYGGGIYLTVGFPLTNTKILYNVVSGSGKYGIVLLDSGVVDCSGMVIAHNTVYNPTAGGLMILSADQMANSKIENNIVWWTSNPTAPAMELFPVPASGFVWDYNLVGPAFTNYLNYNGTTYSTLAAWRAGSGADTHSVSSDPLFANAATGDFTLQKTSPAIDAGTTISGIGQMYSGSAPDMGAFDGSVFTIVGKTGTSGTAVMQKAANGWTYITGKTGTSGTAVDQKGAGPYTKIKGH